MFPNPRLLILAQKSRFWLILTITLGFLSGLLVIGQAKTVSQIISKVFLEGFSLENVWNLLMITLGFFCLRALLSWLSDLSAKTIAVQVKSHVRNKLLTKLKDLGPAFLQGERSGELNRTIVEGVEDLDAYFSQYLPQLVLSAFVPITILVFVFPMDLLSGFVLLVTAPLIPYFMFLIGNRAKAITDQQYSILSQLAAHFLDSLQGLVTLRLFNRADDQVEKIRHASEKYRLTTMKVLRVTFLSALTLELLATLSTAVVAVEIGLRLLYYRLSLEQALFLLLIAPEFYIPLRMLGLRFHAGMQGRSAAERIFEIFDYQPLPFEKSSIKSKGKLSLPMEELDISQVSFTYPEDKEPTLKDINLKVKRGEHIALVGVSGAGKSTLVKLLLGFFPPDEGEILINGNQLGEEDLESWRSQIAWVSQEPALFKDSITANILLARPDASQSAVASAASAAHLADFIDSLPDGYQTQIGEGGARLSGGQAQRLALARAFLKDSPLLILDEPTSQLDPITETALGDATKRLMTGRTVITIAHRLNTVFQADRILVLKDGEIVESGTHQGLMKADGEYKNLVIAYTGSQDYKPNAESSDESVSSQDLIQSDPPPIPAVKTRPDEKSRDIPGAILSRLLSFFRPHWKEVLLSVFLGFTTIASSVGLMGASAWLISMAALHPSIAVLQIAIVSVRFFGITRGVSRYFERLVSHNLTFRILTKLRVWFFESLVPLAPARLIKYKAGDLLSRIISDIKTLEDFYVRSLGPLPVAALIGLGVSLFLLPYSCLLSGLVGFFFLLTGIGLPILIKFLARAASQIRVILRSQLGSHLTEFIQGLPDLIAYNAVDSSLSEMMKIDKSYGSAQIRLARISGVNSAAFILLSNLAMWLVLVISIPLVQSGNIPGVVLAALALLVLSSFEAVQPLPQAMETYAGSIKAGARLIDVIDAEPEVTDPKNPAPFPSPVLIKAKKLGFKYPDGEPGILEGIDFQLQEGQTIALVGPSGAGKSTLTNILLRFWGNYQGEVLLGSEEIPLINISQEEVRGQISVVSQQAHLFNDSIKNNIALGKPDASLAEISQAAEKARLTGLINTLPEGLKTRVGERGTLLSAGERQRIIIARAVIKDAPIFLLDEPTANLDPLTERDILSNLFEITSGKTTLLITHRLVGLDQVDQILVLDRGQIVERGTEAELLERMGVYQRMWDLQNRLLVY